MTNKLIDFYNTLSEKQKERLMYHVDNMTAKERSPRKEKKKQKKLQLKGWMSYLIQQKKYLNL